jgi:hypothetical protein
MDDVQNSFPMLNRPMLQHFNEQATKYVMFLTKHFYSISLAFKTETFFAVALKLTVQRK